MPVRSSGGGGTEKSTRSSTSLLFEHSYHRLRRSLVRAFSAARPPAHQGPQKHVTWHIEQTSFCLCKPSVTCANQTMRGKPIPFLWGQVVKSCFCYCGLPSYPTSHLKSLFCLCFLTRKFSPNSPVNHQFTSFQKHHQYSWEVIRYSWWRNDFQAYWPFCLVCSACEKESIISLRLLKIIWQKYPPTVLAQSRWRLQCVPPRKGSYPSKYVWHCTRSYDNMNTYLPTKQ